MISRRTLVGNLSLAAAAVVGGCRSAPFEDPAAALHQRIQGHMADHPRTPGLAAAMVRGDDVIWKGGFGKADLEIGDAMTPASVMNVGSVTKTVTATAVLQLIEQGRLDMNRDASDYLAFSLRNPAFPKRLAGVCFLIQPPLAYLSLILRLPDGTASNQKAAMAGGYVSDI